MSRTPLEPVARSRARPMRRLALVLVSLAALTGVALLAPDGPSQEAPPPAEAEAAPGKMIVAVLYFDNNTGDGRYDVLQKGLADMLVTDLAGVPALEVVEREKLEQVIGELERQKSNYFDPKTAQKIGRMVGARYAVTGAFAAIDPRMRIDLRLIEVASSRVIMADKVVGQKDAFFELEEALVQKFVRGLDVRSRVAAASGVKDVGTLLQYSEGIDLADKGDLENASQKLGQVVRSAPKFTLAQKKYAEILRRLRLAKKRREKGLGEDEKILLANIERELRADPTTLDRQQASRYFAYRIARGNYELWKLRELAGLPAGEYGPVWVPKGQHDEIRKRQRAFFESTNRFIEEMKAYRRKHRDSRGRAPSIRPNLPEDDQRRGKELGIADDIGAWSFAEPHSVGQALAEFALQGNTPFSLSQSHFVVKPTLAELAPRYGKKALALLDDARAEAQASETGEMLQRAMAENIDIRAEGLLALGRREEAIAVWQSFLETYPKSTEYKKFEGKIEALLGISDKALAFQEALASCDNELMGLMYEEVERVLRAGGSAGIRQLVGEIEGKCVRGQMGPAFALQIYFHAARSGAMRGDCALYREMRARALKLGQAYSETMDQIETGCAK